MRQPQSDIDADQQCLVGDRVQQRAEARAPIEALGDKPSSASEIPAATKTQKATP